MCRGNPGQYPQFLISGAVCREFGDCNTVCPAYTLAPSSCPQNGQAPRRLRGCNLLPANSVPSLGRCVPKRLSYFSGLWRYLMSSTIRTRLSCLLACAVIPFATYAADERACNMRDAALPTNSITYVLCEQGLLLVTKDEGATWAQRKIASPGALRAVAFLDVNRGVTVGDRGAILATNDAGRTWKARESGTTENLTDIQMVGEQGWIAGYDRSEEHTSEL